MGTFAQRMSQVSVSATLKVAAEAERLRRAGHNVVDFSAGEPDFPTPEHVKAAAKTAIDDNFTRYTAAAGMPELREAVCARYKSDYGVDISAAEVLMTVGGKQALFNAALALIDPGDEVVTHAPYWPTIPEQVKLVGGVPVIVPTKSEDGLCGQGRGDHRGDDAAHQGRDPELARQPHRRADRGRRGGGDRRGDRPPRHLDHRRPVLRAADLRAGAAQPAEGDLRAQPATGRCWPAARRRATP